MSLASRARLIRAIRSGDYYTSLQPTHPWPEQDEQRWHGPEFQPQPEPPEPPEPEPPPPPPPPVVSAQTSSAPAPDPEPAPLVEVVDALYRVLPNYLSCSNHQRAILTLWIVHTWCFEVFPATPYLNIYSPEKQSGKTVCLQLLRMLCNNSWMPGGGLTSTRLMDHIARRRPTLLLDDWHTAFRPTEAQSIIGFLNAGFTEDSRYAVRGSDGGEDLSIYCPKAFAGSGPLPAPLADRSIPIVLQRQKSSESFRVFCSTVIHPQTESIARQLRLWFKDYDRLRSVYNHAQSIYESNLPGFSLRQKACAFPLLTMARLIGGKWPRRANLALRRIFEIHNRTALSAGTQLLEDIRTFFMSTHVDKTSTVDLLTYLNALTGRPWSCDQKNRDQKSRDKKGKPLNPNHLRCYLENFGICRSSTQWIAKQKRKGFTMENFIASWDRYLSPITSTELPAAHCEVVETAPEVGEFQSEVGENPAEVGENGPEVGENEAKVGEKVPHHNAQ